MKKIFNLKILSITLYILTGLLVPIFIWSVILALKRMPIEANFLDFSSFEYLFSVLTIPFTIIAATLALLTLAITTSRTLRMDMQLKRMDNQLIEMRTQREASYQPDILIEQRKIFITTGTGKDIIESSRIIGKTDEQFLKINLDESFEKEPNLYLHNLGRGVAKNFKYRFLYDAKDCIKIMNGFNLYNYFTINPMDVYAEILTRGTPQARFWGFYPNEEWKSNVQFILPISGATSPTKILMPYLYTILNFFKDELHLRSKKEFDDPNNIMNLFPKLYYECEYDDAGLKHYMKKFEINFSFMVFRQMFDSSYRFNDITYEYDVFPNEIKEKAT